MNDFKKSLKTTSESLDQKQVAKDRLFNLLNEQFESVRISDLDSDAKTIQSDMLLDLMKFLMNYEKNVEILNEHIRRKRYKDR
uniref:hypothetical protein n=1 Tax=Methanobrevibacter smithii TaxID=2173 RepID=UPI00384FD020